MPQLDSSFYPPAFNALRSSEKFPMWYLGEPSLLTCPLAAIVGTRNISPEGVNNTRRLAELLVSAGVVVVSGMAKGVDRVAHESALAVSGDTIAVMGTPIDECYPKEHFKLKQQIADSGLLLSQFPRGHRTNRGSFPQRNETMALLCPVTFIIEASADSGTKHQVKAALKFGHKVGFLRALVEAGYPWVKEALEQGSGFPISTRRDAIALLRAGGILEAKPAAGSIETRDSPDAILLTGGSNQSEFSFEVSYSPDVRDKKKAARPRKQKKKELPPLLSGFEGDSQPTKGLPSASKNNQTHSGSLVEDSQEPRE